jgi:hypothetical protein
MFHTQRANYVVGLSSTATENYVRTLNYYQFGRHLLGIEYTLVKEFAQPFNCGCRGVLRVYGAWSMLRCFHPIILDDLFVFWSYTYRLRR